MRCISTEMPNGPSSEHGHSDMTSLFLGNK